MDLSTLPLVILDTLFRHIDVSSLLAISRTCTRLHGEANRFLYHDPPTICYWLDYRDSQRESLPKGSHYSRPVQGGMESRMEMLEKSLVGNHANARFLYTHISFDVKLLQALWSHSPLNLTDLRLHNLWFNSSNEREIAKCILSKHPDTYVKRIFLDGVQDGGFRVVLSMLYTFQHLETLHVQIWSEHSLRPDDVLAALNCPQLKRLVIQFSDLLVSLSDKLPHLQILEIYRLDDFGTDEFNREESEYYSPEEKWARLITLMDRHVHFVQTRFPLSYDPDLGLLPFVFHHAQRKKLDPTAIVRWLFESQNRLNEGSRHYVSLRRLSASHREASLCILQTLDIDRECTFEIRLHTHDTINIANFLPKTISHLQIVVSESNRVFPALLHHIIRALPKLRTISIRLYVGSVDEGKLGSNATCTVNGFENKFPLIAINLDFDDYDIVCEYKLAIARGHSPVWTVAGSRDEDGEPIHIETSVDLPELEEEIRIWLSLNSTLENIEIYFDGDTDFMEYYD